MRRQIVPRVSMRSEHAESKHAKSEHAGNVPAETNNTDEAIEQLDGRGREQLDKLGQQTGRQMEHGRGTG